MRIHYQLMLKQTLQDLNPIFMGESECEPNHNGHASSSGNCYVLYRIYRGKGKVQIQGKTYYPTAGQFFLVPPGDRAPFTTDMDDPWFFQWIGFTGALARDFLCLPPVFELPRSAYRHLYDPRTTSENLVSRLTSDLFLIHATMTHPAPPRSDYVQWVVEHITTSYMQKISVADLAAELGINASHLSRQFTKKIGTSIQDYLLTIRIINSKLYLNKGFSVKESALMCGFADANNFTKLFKKKTGYSPTEWKKKLALSEDSRSPFQPYPPAAVPVWKK